MDHDGVGRHAVSASKTFVGAVRTRRNPTSAGTSVLPRRFRTVAVGEIRRTRRRDALNFNQVSPRFVRVSRRNNVVDPIHTHIESGGRNTTRPDTPRRTVEPLDAAFPVRANVSRRGGGQVVVARAVSLINGSALPFINWVERVYLGRRFLSPDGSTSLKLDISDLLRNSQSLSMREE